MGKHGTAALWVAVAGLVGAVSAAVAADASAQDAAIFQAAGLKQVKGHWESGCNDGNDDPKGIYDPATITDRKDINGDGRPDVIITEGGVFCYGNTGQAFWIVTQKPDGSWKQMINAIGIPDLRKTKGVDGWPDILIGGPGMCFPLVRWNGKAYKLIGHSDGNKPCRPFA
ncbi:hypothetical protein [Castellaniella caeni]|uniref:hypothetical protein n=1 Tax=Castellaniella caeni TaxID=266123 RepID=UPI00082C5083|nr:hypothetical protein [Castellaniella caeni]